MTTDSSGHIDQKDLDFRDLIAQFKDIKEQSLSCNLIVEIESEPSRMFCFQAGKLAGISGGINPIDRWQRNLEIANLNLSLDRSTEQNSPEQVLLKSYLLAQQLVTLEVLFDILQICQLTKNCLSYQLISIDPDRVKLKSNLPLLEIKPILATTIKSWQEWQQAGLESYFPSRFLTISTTADYLDTDELSELMIIDNLPEILASIDGSRSLRSLAIHHRQTLIDFAKSLLPPLKSGFISLAVVAKPQLAPTQQTDESGQIATSTPIKAIDRPLIACIDDSILIYINLEKMLAEHNYRSYGVQDPLKVITTLIKNKPDLIFLDLLMPISNGYEVCEQIRKTPSLKHIPIIILTGKDGLFDRMRAKLVGATEFLNKPISEPDVLRILKKYVQSVDGGW